MSSSFSQNNGGCFHENCPIWINQHQKIKALNLMPNMIIFDSNGNETYIEMVIKRKCIDNMVCMSVYEDIGLTPYHPLCILNENDEEMWDFPINLVGAENIRCSYIYNFVLANGGSLLCGNNRIKVCTLGHNLEGPIIGHNFYGSRENGIVGQLKLLFPNYDKQIDLTDYVDIRDYKNGNRVIGIKKI